jgi:hypothetical protein
METWLFNKANGIVWSNILVFAFKITKSPGKTGHTRLHTLRMAQELPIGIGAQPGILR